MDKIKPHLFAILISLTSVVLLVLIYFLVWSPLDLLAQRKTEIATLTNNYKNYNKGPKFPTTAYKKSLEDTQSKNVGAVKEAEIVYNDQQKAFLKRIGDKKVGCRV